jgi:3-hydroxyisobutyrate dehydrogenase-like beta-hydroxyacid dehydrogenase
VAHSRSVGVVGLGRMGAPVAGHLAAAGYAVRGLDPDPGAGAGLPPDVRRVAGYPGLDGCDPVLVLAGGPAVPAILLADGRLRENWRGRDVLVCSTVDPAQMRRLNEIADRDGGRLLDAPLCRGDHGARDGDLLALVGGPAVVLDRCRDVLHAFCSDVVHVGGAGAGQVAKLVNNMLLWANIASVAEGLRLAEELGVRRGPLVEGLRRSSAGSWVLDTWERSRELPWAAEDMRMVLDAAAHAGLDVPVADTVREAIGAVRESAMLAGGGFGAAGWRLPAGADDTPPQV